MTGSDNLSVNSIMNSFSRDHFLATLCNKSCAWTWDFEGQCQIEFAENGTGYVSFDALLHVI
jgi:hypothetical protein